MKLILLFLLSLAIGFPLCSCGSHEIIANELTAPTTPRPPAPPSPTAVPPRLPPPGYDYFVLSLIWPNAYCKETDVTCRPPVPKQYFTIHGLWPQRNDGIPVENCEATAPLTNEILKKYEKRLLDFWPRLRSADDFEKSKNFWYVQWNQHGSCSSNNFPPDNYIDQTLKLGSTYGPRIMNELKTAGIEPNGEKYPWQKITEAINKGDGKDGYLTCTSDTSGHLQLSEIRICFDYNAEKQISCGRPKPPVKCRYDLVFASPPPSPSPPPPPKALDTPIFVSSILEGEDAAEL